MSKIFFLPALSSLLYSSTYLLLLLSSLSIPPLILFSLLPVFILLYSKNRTPPSDLQTLLSVSFFSSLFAYLPNNLICRCYLFSHPLSKTRLILRKNPLALHFIVHNLFIKIIAYILYNVGIILLFRDPYLFTSLLFYYWRYYFFLSAFWLFLSPPYSVTEILQPFFYSLPSLFLDFTRYSIYFRCLTVF